MKKTIVATLALALLSVSAFAQKAELKWYGFVRTYFAYDSRESLSGAENLYYYMPKDVNVVEETDLNEVPSARFATLTSRLGLDVLGYEYEGWKIGARIEADFYSGVSGVTGTAQMRLRQAYTTLEKGGVSWKIGQAWHPMAADLPDIFSLESGAPFGPFSRTPQVTVERRLGGAFSLTASALWQMQYASYGPKEGDVYTSAMSADYIKYGCTPEIYLALNARTEGGLIRIGADLLSIKPMNYDAARSRKVGDRITTLNAYAYAQQKFGNWTGKAKITYAQDGSHLNLTGGYGVSGIVLDGDRSYTPSQSINGWMTLCYRKKTSPWQPQILLGYSRQLGTLEDLYLYTLDPVKLIAGTPDKTYFYGKNNPDKVAQMYRIQPEIIYNLGKFQIGLEYMLTSVQYGKSALGKVLATEDLHWVSNNRIQMMVKYTF